MFMPSIQVDVIAAGRRIGDEKRRPNILLSAYLDELDRINKVNHGRNS
jgi:hypothetical protein